MFNLFLDKRLFFFLSKQESAVAKHFIALSTNEVWSNLLASSGSIDIT